MMRRRALARVLPLLAIIVLFSLACHETASIRFENKTTSDVEIYDDPFDENPEFVLEAGEVTTVGFLRNGYEGRIIARTPDGRILLDIPITWEELKRSGIVIESR
jgi:hypothetical protein